MNAVDIIRFFETKYPKDLAYDWDNVGIQLGTLNQQTKKVLVTLDITKKVVKEAINHKVDLIISHHPLMFKPVKNIIFDSPNGWIIKNLVQHNITVYSAHTNFDVADGGMNDVLANALNISNPTLMDEIDNIGRFGNVDEIEFSDFVQFVKKTFKLETVKVIGNDKKKVSKVGISGGSGSHHMYAAKKKNCDVYITGDITYHTALDAIQLGMTLIDVGHHIEVIFIDHISNMLQRQFPEVEFIKSTVDTNPYKEF